MQNAMSGSLRSDFKEVKLVGAGFNGPRLNGQAKSVDLVSIGLLRSNGASS
jgi:hypothetical protein